MEPPKDIKAFERSTCECLPFAHACMASQVGIDDALVKQKFDTDEEIFEMNNGCICCTVRPLPYIRTAAKLSVLAPVRHANHRPPCRDCSFPSCPLTNAVLLCTLLGNARSVAT